MLFVLFFLSVSGVMVYNEISDNWIFPSRGRTASIRSISRNNSIRNNSANGRKQLQTTIAPPDAGVANTASSVTENPVRPADLSISPSGKPYCESIQDTLVGEWVEANESNKIWPTRSWWEPQKCTLRFFDTFATTSCLKDLKIGFYGDSLLLSIYTVLQQAMLHPEWKPSPSSSNWDIVPDKSPSFYSPQGYTRLKWKNSPGEFVFHWAPSAHHWTPKLDVTSRHDTLIVGQAAWDMGIYYKGVDAFFNSFHSHISQLEARHSKVIVVGLHKLWRDLCSKGPCFACNSPAKEELFRYAQAEAAARARSGSVQLLNTMGLTGTDFGHRFASDAVHYQINVTRMQAQVLLNMLCKDETGHVLRGLPRQPTMPQNCGKNHSLNKCLRDLSGEGSGPCIPSGWSPSHK